MSFDLSERRALTATLDEAVPAAIAAIEEAGRLGARIVCLSFSAQTVRTSASK